MQNAEEVHLTGTGTSQEQLMHYMADTPQFKNTVSNESTSNKMSDEILRYTLRRNLITTTKKNGCLNDVR